VILAGDQATYSVGLQGLSNLDAPYTFFEVGAPQMNINPYVYGLPFFEFFTNVRGTPDGAVGSANESVPWASLESITNTNGQLTTSGFLLDQPAEGFSGFSFNIATYPGLKEMHDRAFDAFRAQMASAYPDLDHFLAEGSEGIGKWWEAVKAKAEASIPGLGNALDSIDFVKLFTSTW
jgi:hypothetical protein